MFVLVHAPPQKTTPFPVGQTHCPAEQISLLPHRWPQAPQFVTSNPISVHAPRQGAQPIGQAVHCPPLQIWLAPQTLPQAPQFCRSVCVLVQ